MPAYDPNSFSDGIGQSEWAMMSADDHLPLMNKTLQGLYPPGSTVKPMVALALLRAGVPATDRVQCSGAYRVGNGLFHCWRHGGHGPIDMHRAIAQSCDIYFYTMARRIGIDQIARMARMLGMGEKYDLPFASQRYGTVPDTAWKLTKYHKPWTVADTVNSAIGQGYMLVNPLQLAVMASRIASGQLLSPRIIGNKHYGPQGLPIGFDREHLDLLHRAMRDVVSGVGTAGSARMQVAGVELAGKTGSAQVRRISMADRRAGRAGALGTAGAWKLRDHGHFLGFAPFDEPRYAIGVTLEHAGHGAAAAQVARDVMTYLFSPERALATLAADEAQWGGGIAERMEAEATRWQTAHVAGPTEAQENAEPGQGGGGQGERGD
jgi:penicillin-binding protein 2